MEEIQAWQKRDSIDQKGTSPPHDLNGVLLGGNNLNGLDLRGFNLRFAKMAGAKLYRANLLGATLYQVDLRGADLQRSILRGVDLGYANLERANIQGADLRKTSLVNANLKSASLALADLRNSDLGGSDIKSANLQYANLSNANVRRIRCNRKTKFLGSRIATIFGSPKFLGFARHQEFLEEMRQSFWGRLTFFLWWLFADCGRSIWRWTLWSIFFVLMFAMQFQNMNETTNAFKYPKELGSNFHTMVYYSVVTFTTLGFGDITPLTREAAYWVMVEVILGYVMLGGLISIFATKLARRF